MDYIMHIKKIKQILEEAKLPKRWYSINKPTENRLSIMNESDGIHVFVPERGDKTGEHIYTDWYNVIEDVANSVELKYTKKIMKIAQKYL